PQKLGARLFRRATRGEAREPAPACGLPIRTAYGRFCAVPGRETAPGAGRSAAPSTRALKLGGMQKMLASVDGLAAPPVVKAPAGEPVRVIVRVVSTHGSDGDPMPQKAPAVRCWQLVNGKSVATQSASVVQGTAKHVGAPP